MKQSMAGYLVCVAIFYAEFLGYSSECLVTTLAALDSHRNWLTQENGWLPGSLGNGECRLIPTALVSHLNAVSTVAILRGIKY